MTVKDVFETVGLRTTSGYSPLKDSIPQQDATVVARLKAAGAIILGKSNLARLAGDYQSTNSLFPRVNNPWNLYYTSGGSSGGSAAAIVTGLLPLELGNDFGGSMRQPAHFCGVYSFKAYRSPRFHERAYSRSAWDAQMYSSNDDCGMLCAIG